MQEPESFATASLLSNGNGYTPAPPIPLAREFVVDEKVGSPGQVRQAGTTDTAGTSMEGRFVRMARVSSERSLFAFNKIVLGFDLLTTHLHLEVCNFVQKCPPYRKLVLLPRDCYKTTIVSKGLPLHIFIQPQDGNVYRPGKLGSNTKILLACETESRGKKHVLWAEQHLMRNKLLRAFWPHMIWENPKSEARAWNSTEMFLPQDLYAEQSDPNLMTVGVGGAITGAHVDVIIDDDLVTMEAMNSPTVMASAIEWHTLSRSLFDDLDKGLEFMVGTHWAVHDLYSHIRKNDPTVTIYKRSLVEDGKIIVPEIFSPEGVQQLRDSYKHMFAFLYQNDQRDAYICDFS